MLLLSATCPRPPGRWENSLRKTVWRTIQRANSSFWSTGWILPDLNTRSIKTSSIWQESFYQESFLGCALIAERIWKGDILVADFEELEKMDASEIYPRRLIAKDVLTTHKDGEFVFPVADGSATLSGRDYEFQEPTQRREHTVRREYLSGESQGDR